MSRDRDRSIVAAAVARAVQTTPVPTIRAATVAQPVAANGTVSVLIDGDTIPSQCELIGNASVTAGDRVLVAFFPPHGAYVIGQHGGSSSSSGGDPAMGGDLSGVASNAQIVAGAVGTPEIADDAVTYAKMQETSAADVLLGSGNGGPGDVEEITLSGLTMTGTTLSVDAVPMSWLPLMPLLE